MPGHYHFSNNNSTISFSDMRGSRVTSLIPYNLFEFTTTYLWLNTLIPFQKFRSPYRGKEAAATRAALTSATGVNAGFSIYLL